MQLATSEILTIPDQDEDQICFKKYELKNLDLVCTITDMKRQITIAALTIEVFVVGTNTVQAQNTTATTNVIITLNDVIFINTGSTAIGNVYCKFPKPSEINY